MHFVPNAKQILRLVLGGLNFCVAPMHDGFDFSMAPEFVQTAMKTAMERRSDG